MAKGYFAPSVKKAFEILWMISGSREGLGISDLARGLQMAKSTVHGMTSALEESGAVVRDPVSKRYTLGFTLFELGRAAFSQLDLKPLARPAMEKLMEKTGTSVFLGILNGEHVTILDVVESNSELKITAPVGARLPLLAGAVGKVLLSKMEEEESARLIRRRGLNAYTPNTTVDKDEYMKEIRLVRKRGYATDDEEYIPGVRAVAAALWEKSHVMAAIWAVGFKASLDAERMKVLVEETRRAAETINQRIRGG